MPSSVASMLMALLLAVCCVALVSARTQFIGSTAATLLSGSTLTACNGAGVNTSDCSNGMAAVAYYVRKYERDFGQAPTVIPFVDRQTAFVQMYPTTWAVNALILPYLGFSLVTAPPSLFTSSTHEGWEFFHNTTNFKVTLANVHLLPSDVWYPTYTPYVIVDRVALMFVDSDSAANTLDPYAVINNFLQSFQYLQNTDGTVVWHTDSLIAVTDVYNSIGTIKPDVLVTTGSTSLTKIGSTFIVSAAFSSSTLTLLDLTRDDTTGRIVGAAAIAQSLSIAIGTGDATYYEQQIVMSGYAAGAGTNDPVLGTSGFMPVHRSGSMRLCLGGECPGGRLFAEAMRFVEKTDVAFTSSGAFRGDGWPAGTFKISNVWATNPFANPVCVGTVRGLSLFEAFNFSIAHTTAPDTTASQMGDRLLQTAGVKIVFNNLVADTRILSISILDRATGQYEALDKTKLYTYAADSYVSTVFSPFPTFLSARYAGEVAPVCSTERIMQTEVTTYMANISAYNVSDQGNLVISTSSTAVLNLVQTQTDCAPGTIWVASLASCVDCPAGMTSSAGALSCSPESTSNLMQTIAIAVPVGVVGLLCIVGYLIYAEREKRKNQRNIDNAPKSGEVVLMFTDIQDSTKLWGTCPASMSLSLDHHHRIIRECISEHKGYEVKTVGDCFMIAISGVDAGVSLAVSIQHKLQEQAFPKAISAVYACKTEDDLDAVDDNPEDLAELDPLFNGLRVRIGMHCGTPDCVFDEVTRGYDYYGPPVNVAARVESTAKGGQINASRDLVSRMDVRDDVEVVFFSAVELKGVSGLTEILHIVPKNLSGRVAIYQAMAKDEKSDSDSEQSTNDTQSIMSGGVAGQDAELIRRFTSYLFAAIKVMKPKAQRELVHSIMKAWRVKVPSKELPIEDEIKLFAGRATRGIKRQEALNAAGNFGGLSMRMSMRRHSVASGVGASAPLDETAKSIHAVPAAPGGNALPQQPPRDDDTSPIHLTA